MKEIIGDLFAQSCDAICITTNGFLKKNGEGVMGAGVAKQAAIKYPAMPGLLGHGLTMLGNNVFVLGDFDKKTFVAFPVKHKFFEVADIALIEKSCKQLMDLVESRGWNNVCTVRPGCGNGKLNWQDVKSICEKYFDDRITIVNDR